MEKANAIVSSFNTNMALQLKKSDFSDYPDNPIRDKGGKQCIVNPLTKRCVLLDKEPGKSIHTAYLKYFVVAKAVCPADKILNPATNKCVLKSGKIGKELMARENHTCFEVGLLQTTGTCWFNTIVNGLILSDKIYKLLLKKYNKLSQKEKAGLGLVDAACPLHFKKLYFYKIFHQFVIGTHAKVLNSPIYKDTINYPQKMIDRMGIRSTPDWHDVKPGYKPGIALPKVLSVLFDEGEYVIVDPGEVPVIAATTQMIFMASSRVFIRDLESLTIPLH